MPGRLLARFRRSRRRPATGREALACRRLAVEWLETRELLSVSPCAVPDCLRYSTGGAALPMSTAGPTGYTPAEIRHAYGFDRITFGSVAGTGAGTTIAIVDAYDDPCIASDLHQFDLQFGLPDPVFRKVNQTGGTKLPAANKLWATEIALDVEWAHAVAPEANILLVEANSSSYSDLMAAVDFARRAPGVVAVSMSWGSSEFVSETSYDTYFTTPAGHAGVTFLASSGDNGAPASYPAVSSNVISVGGTSLSVSQGSYAGELAWSGSGGGVSSYQRQPAYQNGIVTQTRTYRANPDVAYDSDPATGFPVYDTYNNPKSAPWGQWGGTSAAAPQWAGLVAIADQGRALAGKSSLDGATQTLPLLYAMPGSNFHDILSGASTGNPSYYAAPGYDLVTGRGTPYADRVVSSLVSETTTPTATRFGVTASVGTKCTAGQAFSITVSAVDPLGNLIAGYRGTVHLSSSDKNATLPADYTFTANDGGVHTFTGVVLTTSLNQTVTVVDTGVGYVAGELSITVSAAAAHHLAFGQQPTAAVASTVISPAVTVRVVDQYDNVVLADNTHKVTMSIGTNPGGGSLAGTTTVTAANGTASFSDLKITKPGNGYTLVATCSGLGKATSWIFLVSGTAVTLEGFESGNLASYAVVGASLPTAAVSSKTRHDGSYALSDAAGSDWIYRNDSAVKVQQGDTISVWMEFSGTASGRSYFGFGASSAGALALVAAPNSGELLLQDCSGYTYTNLGAVSQIWQPNRWYRMEVCWGAGGAIVGKLYDSNGTTLLNTVTGKCSKITSGGIAFRSISTTTWWDTVQATRGVNATSGVAAMNLASALARRSADDLFANWPAASSALRRIDLAWLR